MKKITPTKENIEYSQFVDEIHQFYLKIHPTLITYKGKNLNGFQPVSYKDNFNIIKKYKEFLEEMERFRNNELSDRQIYSKKCLIFMMTSAIESFKHFWLQFPLAPYSNSEILNFNGFLDFTFRNHEDMQDYLHLLDDLAKIL
ncbi:MAG: hypothetical protein ACTSRX_02615, partial [Promethearchaeota archaeon]